MCSWSSTGETGFDEFPARVHVHQQTAEWHFSHIWALDTSRPITQQDLIPGQYRRSFSRRFLVSTCPVFLTFCCLSVTNLAEKLTQWCAANFTCALVYRRYYSSGYQLLGFSLTLFGSVYLGTYFKAVVLIVFKNKNGHEYTISQVGIWDIS